MMVGVYTSYEGIKDTLMAKVLSYLNDGSVQCEFAFRGNYPNLLNLETAIMFSLYIYIIRKCFEITRIKNHYSIPVLNNIHLLYSVISFPSASGHLFSS